MCKHIQMLSSWKRLDCQSCFGQLSLNYAKLTESLHRVFIPKISCVFNRDLTHNDIVSTLKIHLCPLHIGQVLKLPDAINPELVDQCILPECSDSFSMVTPILHVPFPLNLGSSLKWSQSHQCLTAD